MGARGVRVRQSLFARRGPDGRVWEFASLADGGCALLCDGDVLARGDGSEETIAYLLREFQWLSGRRLGGAVRVGPAAWSSDDADASSYDAA